MGSDETTTAAAALDGAEQRARAYSKEHDRFAVCDPGGEWEYARTRDEAEEIRRSIREARGGGPVRIVELEDTDDQASHPPPASF